ncbi:hypothetical protein BHM03_00049667 [Ensete ventricosum]|nr:hypothetical protein BHM03_00049667 [Ensete ventricosum]
MPKGPVCAGNAAQKPPVSELESPKLKIAGNTHLASLAGPEQAKNSRVKNKNGNGVTCRLPEGETSEGVFLRAMVGAKREVVREAGGKGNWAAEMGGESMACDAGVIEGIRQDLTAGGGRGGSSCDWILCREPFTLRERCNGGDGKDGDSHAKRVRAERKHRNSLPISKCGIDLYQESASGGREMASAAQEVAKESAAGRCEQHEQQQREHGKQSSRSASSSRWQRSGRGESEVIPEWKLKCLCAEPGVPVIMSGILNMGGCF